MLSASTLRLTFNALPSHSLPNRSSYETSPVCPDRHRRRIDPEPGQQPAFAQTKWDLPAAYPATNFHSVNLQQFANDVDKASGGKLKITVHANAARCSRHPRSSAPCRAARPRPVKSCW
jgi:hypothetical protein